MLRCLLMLFGFLALTCGSEAAAQTIRYIHTDALGSVVAITNASAQVVERREYEPYGLQLTPTLVDGPGYTGHVQDAATGLTYMQQRYYDPAIGRFLSVDPVTALDGGQLHFNRYLYAYNNPYKFSDPDGRCPMCIVAIIYGIGALLHSEAANAPAPGETLERTSAADGIAAALPPGKLLTGVRITANMAKQANRYRRSDYRYRSDGPAAKAARRDGEGKPCPKCGETMVPGTKTSPQAQHEPPLSEKHYEGGGAQMSSAEKKAYANSPEAMNGSNCRTCQAKEGAAQREYVRKQEK